MLKNEADINSGAAESKPMLRAGLYIVATPIGNRADITQRALEVLKGADMLLCEDTRVTGALLTHYGIKASMHVYNDHSAQKMRPMVLRNLSLGKVVALVSDAGTPLVSDPGYKLVQEAKEAGIAVVSLPGACAAIVALTLSTLPSDTFFFGGFLPPKSAARCSKLEQWRFLDSTLIFYERAERVPDVLADMQTVLGARQLVIARELTKTYEEVLKGDAASLLAEIDQRGGLRGEVVLLVSPPEGEPHSREDLDGLLVEAMKRLSVKQAVAEVAEVLKLPRKEVYARALELREENKDALRGDEE